MMPMPFVRLCQIVLPVTSVSNVFSASGKSSRNCLHAPFKSRRQVHHQAADAEIARRHSSARRGFDQIQDLFALPESRKRKRDIAPMSRAVRSEPDHVRSDPLQLAQQDANDLRAFRNFEAEQLLRRHHVREIIPERIEIIHPVGDDDALLVFLVFEELLHSRVEIADVRHAP